MTYRLPTHAAPALRSILSALTLLGSVSLAATASADAGVGDASAPASDSGAPAEDAGAPPANIPPLPSCPGAINTQDVPVSFMRMGPVDALPGTGMRMVGSRTFGLEFNLLFSGTYDLAMAGTLHLNWLNRAAPITITTDGTPATGNFRVNYGLRMVGRIFVAGATFDLPLSNIIMDNESMGRAMFDPWQFEYTDATRIHLNVSAWRTVYSRTFNIGGEDYPVDVQMRFNMTCNARTLEIGFPNRMAGAMGMAFGAINTATPAVTVPVPRDGVLPLAVRWKPQIRYVGSLQFRLVVRRRVCVVGICSNIDVPTPDFASIPIDRETLPDPFEPTDTRVLLPLQQVDLPELDFGSVRLGTTAMQSLVVLNPGASPLAMAISEPGERAFRLGMNTACVAPTRDTTIPVTFAPTSLGQFRSEVTIGSNSANNNPLRVALIGRGAEVTVPPTSSGDGGVRDGGSGGGDGGRGGRTGTEYRGAELDAGCACRTSVPTHHNTRAPQTLALAALAVCASGLVRRARKR
ncbi:MAG: hypothetical protein Q8Q09_15235 [Deltaproteobacteria bacterium]|nr:hypothetical protein [Deltaproteobacteria bacterium]